MDNDPWGTSFLIYTSDPLSPEEAIGVFNYYLEFITQEPVMRQIHGIELDIRFFCIDADMYYAWFHAKRSSVYESKDQMGQDIEFDFVDERNASDQLEIWSFWYDIEASD